MLKPTVLGPPALPRLRRPRPPWHGVAAIVSHALEGPIGYAACLERSARELGGRDPHGLARHPALAAAPHDPALSIALAPSTPRPRS